MSVSCCLEKDTWLSWLPVPVLTTLGTLTGLMVLMASERFSLFHLPLPCRSLLGLKTTKPLSLGPFKFPIQFNASPAKILSTSQHQRILKRPKSYHFSLNLLLFWRFIFFLGKDNCDLPPISQALMVFLFLEDVDIFTGDKFCNSREANPLRPSAHINRNIRAAGLKHATCSSETLLNLIFSKE